MTRKCVMCQGKNYKNSYSFFSAPKDTETRKLWEKVINIKDYKVTDDTFVCSKHFKKDDIITHWISGVPPQVISIEYKKCRLKQGAVPIPVNCPNDTLSIDLPSEPNEKENLLLVNEPDYTDNQLQVTQTTDESEFCLPDISIPDDESTFDQNLENEFYSEKKYKKQKLTNNEENNFHMIQNNQIVLINENSFKENSASINCNSIIEISSNDKKVLIDNGIISDEKENTLMCLSDNNDLTNNFSFKENNVKIDQYLSSNIFETDDACDIENDQKIQNNSDNDLNNSVMLFEDLLDNYAEIALPNQWSSFIISKDQIITIGYVNMNTNNSGIPFIEKQVFINNEMSIRCCIMNKEIDINNCNFFKNRLSLKIRNLSDLEDFIEDFDQIVKCKGITQKDCKFKKNLNFIVSDGLNWRHTKCALFVNKGENICLKCSTLKKIG